MIDDREVEPPTAVLRGGVIVPVAAILLALRLEERGIRLYIDKDDHLRAGPSDRINEADKADIRAHLRDLRAIASYVAPEVPS